MTDSRAKQEHHDHSQMDHDAHPKPTADTHAEHMTHTAAAEGGHEMHGMDMTGEHAQHADHSGHEDMFRTRFWISLLLSIPVLLYTPMLQMWFGFRMPEFVGSQWMAALFAVIVFVYGGVPFLQMAVPEIRNRQPGMMLLI